MRARVDPSIRVLAQPTLSHVALELELLLAEVRDIDLLGAPNPGLTQQDINQLHTMVANCLLFLDPIGRGQ